VGCGSGCPVQYAPFRHQRCHHSSMPGTCLRVLLHRIAGSPAMCSTLRQYLCRSSFLLPPRPTRGPCHANISCWCMRVQLEVPGGARIREAWPRPYFTWESKWGMTLLALRVSNTTFLSVPRRFVWWSSNHGCKQTAARVCLAYTDLIGEDDSPWDRAPPPTSTAANERRRPQATESAYRQQYQKLSRTWRTKVFS
jgi:hypothetical protein